MPGTQKAKQKRTWSVGFFAVSGLPAGIWTCPTDELDWHELANRNCPCEPRVTPMPEKAYPPRTVELPVAIAHQNRFADPSHSST